MITIFKQDNNKTLLKNVYNKFEKDKWVNGNIVKVLEKNINNVIINILIILFFFFIFYLFFLFIKN